ncbi:hypothetical protein HNP32_000494 [Brevundimonas bullata]|uniref:Uncharacterized protein n=1 Tax=Brevundimonas bullata TaxID=13160 RepID=A0A7W7ILY9_9CAUL|nr:DUF1178 family protein [Brevundimonas bullata]MBB4796780.1 hypothetical protein [Brevundimonas bullata]MBB6381739.1 hypothetical protein [Brevundimonas bullata]
MIRYALSCDHDHGFEAWFASSSDYDDQAARGLVECPFCGSTGVRKQVMAPAVAGTKKAAPAPDMAKMQAMMMQAARQVRDHVEQNFDYVGDAFAREARDIHEGRSEKREIYGEATPADIKKLKDDGVSCAALPSLPPDPKKAN